MDQSKFTGEDTWLGDEDLLDFDSEEECDEGVAHASSREMLCGVEMEVEPSSAPEQSEEPSIRAEGDLSGETHTNVTEPGETRRHEDDGKPKAVDLREVIERAKKQSRQKDILTQDLDRVVEDAKSRRAENKGRKRQRAHKVDPSKFIQATSTRLQEPKKGLLWRALQILGMVPMEQLLIEVEAIERAGGQLIADGSRRRSPGGVFWNVVKQRVKPEVYTSIFAEEQAKSKIRKRGKPSKKRKKQEAGAVHLEGFEAQPESLVVDFKSLVAPEDGLSADVEAR